MNKFLFIILLLLGLNLKSQNSIIGNFFLDSTLEWNEKSKSFKNFKNDFIGDMRVIESVGDSILIFRYKNHNGDVLFDIVMKVTNIQFSEKVDTYLLTSDDSNRILLEISNDYIMLYFGYSGDTSTGYYGFHMVELLKPLKLKLKRQ